jgi:hypothetical protein
MNKNMEALTMCIDLGFEDYDEITFMDVLGCMFDVDCVEVAEEDSVHDTMQYNIQQIKPYSTHSFCLKIPRVKGEEKSIMIDKDNFRDNAREPVPLMYIIHKLHELGFPEKYCFKTDDVHHFIATRKKEEQPDVSSERSTIISIRSDRNNVTMTVQPSNSTDLIHYDGYISVDPKDLGEYQFRKVFKTIPPQSKTALIPRYLIRIPGIVERVDIVSSDDSDDTSLEKYDYLLMKVHTKTKEGYVLLQKGHNSCDLVEYTQKAGIGGITISDSFNMHHSFLHTRIHHQWEEDVFFERVWGIRMQKKEIVEETDCDGRPNYQWDSFFNRVKDIREKDLAKQIKEEFDELESNPLLDLALIKSINEPVLPFDKREYESIISEWLGESDE